MPIKTGHIPKKTAKMNQPQALLPSNAACHSANTDQLTEAGGVSISTTDVRPGVGSFCNGQITWEDGPSPGRTVLVELKFPEPRNVLSYELFLLICNLMGS